MESLCFSKYNYSDKNNILDLEDDPAYVHSNGMLVSPTTEQYNELIKYCNCSKSTINGVKGYKVQSKTNDEYIFLPTAGYYFGGSLYYDQSNGYYWTRNLKDSINDAYCIRFDSTTIYLNCDFNRSYGFSIRGVLL